MTHLDVDTFSIYPEIMKRDLVTWQLTPKAEGGINAKTITKLYWSH